EWVVGMAGALGDRQAGRVAEAVRRSDDEVRERVPRVEVGRAALATDAGRLDADFLAVEAVGRRDGLSPLAAIDTLYGRLDRRRPHDELDLDAIADDARKCLTDQRAISGLEPILCEPVRDGDPEALFVDVDQTGVAQPR